MAGLPPSVIARAGEVLADLERDTTGTKRRDLARTGEITPRNARLQMTLFEAETHPVLARIRGVDLSTLSPIEALNLLYQMQKDAREK